MDILRMDVSYFFQVLKPFVFFILFFGISGIFMKSKNMTFEKLLSLFKITFYGFLIYGSLWVNVEVIDDKYSVTLELAKELNLGQLLVIAISILEVASNLITFLKLPPSDFKYITREVYNLEKYDQKTELIELKSRIRKIEEAIQQNKD